jgi:light-regulated signal transduction histidine kinase (bacteriophytochrome)
VYYFRRSFLMRREKFLLLSKLSEQACQPGSSPGLRQHLSVVIFEYKKGLDHYIRRFHNCIGKPEDYQTLIRQIDETNDFIDRLKKWMDEQPYHSNLPSVFEAGKITGVIVRMLQIVFHSKLMTVQNHIGDDIIAFCNRIYFGIAFEILLFRLMQDSEPSTAIILSACRDNDFVTFTLASPSYVIPDEIRNVIRLLIQKLQTDSKIAISLQTRAEICLKCIYENNGEIWFESNPERGTIVNFSIPGGQMEN